jgi:hypothetical protein
MKTLLIIKGIILIALLTDCQQASTERTQSPSTQYADTIDIPRNLEDCLIQIDQLLPDSVKHSISTHTEDEFSVVMHLSLGLWIRNNWGLWKGSRLSNFFYEIGVFHPDDMSAIILDSYYRRSTGKDIKLEEQVKYYQDYWKVTRQPTKDDFPQGVQDIEFYSSYDYKTKTNGHGCVHVGTRTNSKDIWLYDYYLGWIKVTTADIKKIERNPDSREKVLVDIYKRSKL